MQEKKSAKLLSWLAVINILPRALESIAQEVANIQWSSKEVQKKLTLTGDDTYHFVKHLATNQNSIRETLCVMVQPKPDWPEWWLCH